MSERKTRVHKRVAIRDEHYECPTQVNDVIEQDRFVHRSSYELHRPPQQSATLLIALAWNFRRLPANRQDTDSNDHRWRLQLNRRKRKPKRYQCLHGKPTKSANGSRHSP